MRAFEEPASGFETLPFPPIAICENLIRISPQSVGKSWQNRRAPDDKPVPFVYPQIVCCPL
jgi:hypothetical protein